MMILMLGDSYTAPRAAVEGDNGEADFVAVLHAARRLAGPRMELWGFWIVWSQILARLDAEVVDDRANVRMSRENRLTALSDGILMFGISRFRIGQWYKNCFTAYRCVNPPSNLIAVTSEPSISLYPYSSYKEQAGNGTSKITFIFFSDSNFCNILIAYENYIYMHQT